MADFIGKINFLKGTVKGREGDFSIVDIGDEGFQSEIRTICTDFSPGADILASIRPENIHIKPEDVLLIKAD